MGKNETLCDPKSPFQQSLSRCAVCILQHPNSSAAGNTVAPQFQQFLDYCATVAGTNATLVALAQSAVNKEASIMSQMSVLSASQSSLGGQLSLLGYQPVTTLPNGDVSTLTTGTTLSRSSSSTAKVTSHKASPLVTTVLITPKASSTPTPIPKPHSNTGAIVEAVVLPVVAITLMCIAVFLLLRRRKIRNAEKENYMDEKPQLHSDDLKPLHLELDSNQVWEMKAGSEQAPKVVELPALEIVGSEMDAESRQQQRGDATRPLSSHSPTSDQTESSDQ